MPINTRMLSDPNMQEQYTQRILGALEKLLKDTKSVEEGWVTLKVTITQAATEICGNMKPRGWKPKITAWWKRKLRLPTRRRNRDTCNGLQVSSKKITPSTDWQGKK